MSSKATPTGLYGLPIVKRKQQWRDFWTPSYILDYATIAVIAGIAFPFWSLVIPVKYYFVIGDPDLSWPLITPTFSQGTVIILVIIPIPIVLVLLQFWFRSLHDLHHALLGFIQTIAISALIHGCIWVSLGKPRPNFFTKCIPAGNGTCTNEKAIINERHDFPSGHEAFLVAVGIYFALYVWGKWKTFETAGFFHSVFFPLGFVLFGVCVGTTRVANGWHSGNCTLSSLVMHFLMSYI